MRGLYNAYGCTLRTFYLKNYIKIMLQQFRFASTINLIYRNVNQQFVLYKYSLNTKKKQIFTLDHEKNEIKTQKIKTNKKGNYFHCLRYFISYCNFNPYDTYSLFCKVYYT